MDFKPEYLEKEAEMLLKHPVMKLAVQAMIDDAHDALVQAPADDMREVTYWQQRVQACEGLLDQLQGYILAMAELETSALYEDPDNEGD